MLLPLAATYPASLPGLIRQSIRFERTLFAEVMDARVEPGHDDLRAAGHDKGARLFVFDSPLQNATETCCPIQP